MTLETFVALIALDPDRRRRFLADPEADLEASGIDPRRTAGLVPTLERLSKALNNEDFPLPNQPIGGG